MKAKTYRKLVKKAQASAPETETATLAAPVSVEAAPETPVAVEEPQGLLSQVIAGVRADLPTLQAVAVVDAASGIALAAYSGTYSLHLETAAAYSSEVVKQKQKALAALKLTHEKIEDILMTLSSQLHLIKLTADGSKFVYLVVSVRDTNLAVARDVLRNSVEALA